MPNARSLPDRFWSRVEIRGEAECWPWLAARTTAGYGNLWTGRTTAYAHRFAWELHHRQPIPAGMFVCHVCDNPPCVNPGHLFLGTNADNNRDMQAKGRASGGTRGEQQHHAILTEAAVRDIRARIAAGERNAAIARRYGVDRSTISAVRTGKNWWHVL